ncbi:MAG TPA: ferritin-like domain-containing protein [Bryobacteraceae bacterium]|nr:ferritin-like domain-containing protein [Bryobacteraceae bacterium]
MKIQTLQDLFLEEIKDLYNAENQLVKALPKMAKAAKSPELKAAFQAHLEETKGQVERLVQVFAVLGKPVKGKTCAAMKGLIEEGSELISEDAEPHVKDAGLIVAAQKVEHYEIASYGSLCVFAELLGLKAAKKLLKETMAEEESADKKLTQIAEGLVNSEALASH